MLSRKRPTRRVLVVTNIGLSSSRFVRSRMQKHWEHPSVRLPPRGPATTQPRSSSWTSNKRTVYARGENLFRPNAHLIGLPAAVCNTLRIATPPHKAPTRGSSCISMTSCCHRCWSNRSSVVIVTQMHSALTRLPLLLTCMSRWFLSGDACRWTVGSPESHSVFLRSRLRITGP